jgi:hypothetical protein
MNKHLVKIIIQYLDLPILYKNELLTKTRLVLVDNMYWFTYENYSINHYGTSFNRNRYDYKYHLSFNSAGEIIIKRK